MNKGHLRAWISKTRDDEAPPPPSKPSSVCMVDGCPLPGVYRQNDEQSLCCVHEGEDGHRWPIQTQRINENFPLFDAALRMTNALAGEAPSIKLVARIMGMGGSEPKSIEGRRMTVRLYGAQIRGELIAKCKGPKEIPQQAKEAIDSWQKIAQTV